MWFFLMFSLWLMLYWGSTIDMTLLNFWLCVCRCLSSIDDYNAPAWLAYWIQNYNVAFSTWYLVLGAAKISSLGNLKSGRYFSIGVFVEGIAICQHILKLGEIDVLRCWFSFFFKVRIHSWIYTERLIEIQPVVSIATLHQ